MRSKTPETHPVGCWSVALRSWILTWTFLNNVFKNRRVNCSFRLTEVLSSSCIWQRFLRKHPSVQPANHAHLKEERVGVDSQLAQQFGLDLCVDALLTVLQRGVYLAGGQVQLPAEGDAHHIHVISAVAKGAGQGDKH